MKIKIITYDLEIKTGHNIAGMEVPYSNELNKKIIIYDEVKNMNYNCDKKSLLIDGQVIELNGSDLELYCDEERIV